MSACTVVGSLSITSASLATNLCRVFTPHERRGIFETIFYYSVLELDLLDMQISFPALLEALSETVMSINPEVKGKNCA